MWGAQGEGVQEQLPACVPALQTPHPGQVEDLWLPTAAWAPRTAITLARLKLWAWLGVGSRGEEKGQEAGPMAKSGRARPVHFQKGKDHDPLAPPVPMPLKQVILWHLCDPSHDVIHRRRPPWSNHGKKMVLSTHKPQLFGSSATQLFVGATDQLFGCWQEMLGGEWRAVSGRRGASGDGVEWGWGEGRALGGQNGGRKRQSKGGALGEGMEPRGGSGAPTGKNKSSWVSGDSLSSRGLSFH